MTACERITEAREAREAEAVTRDYGHGFTRGMIAGTSSGGSRHTTADEARSRVETFRYPLATTDPLHARRERAFWTGYLRGLASVSPRPSYVVKDRNARDARAVLAGPFAGRLAAEAEASLWRGVTDAYVTSARA